MPLLTGTARGHLWMILKFPKALFTHNIFTHNIAIKFLNKNKFYRSIVISFYPFYLNIVCKNIVCEFGLMRNF